MAYQYFNQCDRWRTKYENGEANWNRMMENKQAITVDQFKKLSDFDGLLDPDDKNDTIENFVSDDSGSGFYTSMIGGTRVLFVQTSGFEFIFTKDGNEPIYTPPLPDYSDEPSL